MRENHNYWPVGLALAVIAVFAVGGAYSYAYFADTEAAAVSIQASDDFTKDAGVAIVRPGQIPNVSTGATVHVFLNVTDAGAVAESAFSIRLAGDPPGEGVVAEQAYCTENQSESWDCRVRFTRNELLGLVDREPGTYDVIVQGWWQNDRDFEAAGELVVMSADTPSSAEGDTPTESTETTQAPTNTTAGTPSASTSNTTTSSPTGAPTPTETPTPTPSATATAAPTSTATNESDTSSPTATSTSASTDTPTPTTTKTPTPTAEPTPISTPTATQTPTPTATPTSTPTPAQTPTSTPTSTQTATATPSPTDSPTATPTPTESVNQAFRWLWQQFRHL